ncbi:hypothetical protein [Erythrobacter donghaensis]|uniref:hypothetical protein n=1 Tax=Erythrobacter donghaensis TaxID=267135 RepID=UPI00117DB3ED|nr:hypothetical protein [Erythrobacter donghaensis]
MAGPYADGDRRLIRLSGLAVIGLHFAYAAVTACGFVALELHDAPIADPWFAAMEWLIILIGPAVLLFLAALGRIEGARQVWIHVALALAVVTFALSASLHTMILALGRESPLVAPAGPLGFTWPSVAYAIDILAWDWFFALGLLCCAMALREVPHMLAARRTFLAAGLLALTGLAGPLTGAMMLRNLGIIGYAVVFPLAVVLVLRTPAGGRSA